MNTFFCRYLSDHSSLTLLQYIDRELLASAIYWCDSLVQRDLYLQDMSQNKSSGTTSKEQTVL